MKFYDIFAVSPECMMVTITQKDDYNEGNNGVNIAIAAFTTSYARLKLLKMMEKLGERLIYFDTDSVIFIQRPGEWEPPLGNILGDWDNQLEITNLTSLSLFLLDRKFTATSQTLDALK